MWFAGLIPLHFRLASATMKVLSVSSAVMEVLTWCVQPSYTDGTAERKIIMLELFFELFRPPYDVYEVLIVLLLLLFVAYTVEFIYCSFRYLLLEHKITRFFAEHSVTTGIVVGYETIDGLIYTTASLAVPGASTILVPRFHQAPDQFTVTLECRDAGVRFYAEYQIPSRDYKEHKKGESIRIKDEWTPIGFQIL